MISKYLLSFGMIMDKLAMYPVSMDITSQGIQRARDFFANSCVYNATLSLHTYKFRTE